MNYLQTTYIGTGAHIEDQDGNDIKIGYADMRFEKIQNEELEKFFLSKFNLYLNFKVFGLDPILGSKCF